MKLLILILTTYCHRVFRYLLKSAEKVAVLTGFFKICYKHCSMRKLGQEHWPMKHKTVNSCEYVLGGGWVGECPKNILVLTINSVRLEIKLFFLLSKVGVILQKANIKQIFCVLKYVRTLLFA